MIGQTDLLPASCRRKFEHLRKRRRWIAGYGAAVCSLALVQGAAALRTNDRIETRNELRAQVKERFTQNEEAMALVAEIRDLEARVTRYNALASPVRVTEVLRTVGAFVPEEATITSITLTPRTDRTRTPARPGQPAEEIVDRYLVLELQGVTQSDITVAGIVAGIDDSPLFSSVFLDFSRQRDVDETLAREFRVNAEIGLDARYDFAVAEALP